MIIEKPLLNFLGQNRHWSNALGPGTRPSLAQQESDAHKTRATLDYQLSLPVSAKRGTFIEFSSEGLASAARVLPHLDASLSFRFERREFPSDVGQFDAIGLRKVIAFTKQATNTSTSRGRITGPVKFVKQLLTTWRLELPEACILLGFEPSESDHVKDVLQGYATLRGRDANDRIAHLFQIRKLLSALFRDEAVENEWLRETRDALQGKAPMDLLLEGSMENLLLVKEYVEVVTGR